MAAGIGDGGNELGMGKLKETVKDVMPNGSLIACDVPADYAVTAGMNAESKNNCVTVGAHSQSAEVVKAYIKQDKHHF